MSDVDIRREKLVKQFKFGGLALALLLVVPFLFTLAMMAAGTVVAASIAVVGGIVLVNFIPVISMKAANRRLKAMKAEARENPIETAENQLVKMSQQLDAFQQDTASYLAKGKALIDDVAEMRKEDPEGAAAYNDDIKNFEIEAVLRSQKIQAAVTELEEARTKWDVYVGKL